jgi:hypothetical protein
VRPAIVLLILALLTGMWLQPASVDKHDPRLGFDNGIVTLGGRPYSGTIVERAADGRLRSTTEYRDGRRDGLAMRFDVDGTPVERRHWVRGKREGTHAGWYPGSGRPRFCFVFHADLHDGPAYEWADRPSSPPLTRYQFERGNEVGMQRVWRVDGVVRVNYLASGPNHYGLQGKKECSR